MMKYGAEHVEHKFTLSFIESEVRGQWRDIYLRMHLEVGEMFPEDLIDPSILVICNLEGRLFKLSFMTRAAIVSFNSPTQKKRKSKILFRGM